MPRIPALAGYSLLSAVGALPFLIMPAITGAALASGIEVIEVLSQIGIAIGIGAFLSSLLSPIIFGNRIKVLFALGASALLLTFVLMASLSTSVVVLALWVMVGFVGGVLQYFGTTMAVNASDPVTSSRMRLAISLVVSGLFILISSSLIHSGYMSLRYFFAASIFVLTLFSGLIFFLSSRKVIEDHRIRDDEAPSSGVMGGCLGYLIVGVFFATFLPFASILPAFIETHSVSETLFHIGLAKVAAMPILLAFASVCSLLSAQLYRLLNMIVLISGSVAAISLPNFVSFTILEVGINSCAALILGDTSRGMSPAQRTWLFLSIELGAICGFFALGILEEMGKQSWFLCATIFVPVCLIFLNKTNRYRLV